jgi:hypothetical protein
MGIELVIVTSDNILLGEIFNEPITSETRPIVLGQGVTIRGIEWSFGKSIPPTNVASIIIEGVVGIPFSVVAALVYDWLFGHKNKINYISIERTEVKMDDRGKICSVIIEKLEQKQK